MFYGISSICSENNTAMNPSCERIGTFFDDRGLEMFDRRLNEL